MSLFGSVSPPVSLRKRINACPQRPPAFTFSTAVHNGPNAQKASGAECTPPKCTPATSTLKDREIPDESLRTIRRDGIDLYLSRFIVHIQVKHNEGNQDFFIHRDLLLSRSQFFKEQLSSTKTLGTQLHYQTFELSNVPPNTFALYANLLYSKKLTTRGPDEWEWLCSLYILGERFQDTEARNTVIDGMILYFREMNPPVLSKTAEVEDAPNMSARSLKWLYEHTPENSTARRLVVEFYAQTGRAEWLQANKESYPIAFVWDVAIRLMQKRSTAVFRTGWEDISASDYHEPTIACEKPCVIDEKVAAE